MSYKEFSRVPRNAFFQESAEFGVNRWFFPAPNSEGSRNLLISLNLVA
jgi:hypothetical protein